MVSGRIAVSNDSFYCGAVDGVVCQLALKTDIPEPVDMGNYVTKEELEEAIGVQPRIVGTYIFPDDAVVNGVTATMSIQASDYVEVYGIFRDDDNDGYASFKTITYKGFHAAIFNEELRTHDDGTAALNSAGTTLTFNDPYERWGDYRFTVVCYKYV